MYGYCEFPIYSLEYNKIHIQSVYNYNLIETQTRLSRHYKFISAENITILSVSSDDFLYASLSSHFCYSATRDSNTC